MRLGRRLTVLIFINLRVLKIATESIVHSQLERMAETAI